MESTKQYVMKLILLTVILWVTKGVLPATARTTEQPIPIWLNWDYNCHALDKQGIIAMVKEAKAAGVQGISLRISNKGALNYRPKTGQPYTERLDAFGKDYDPLQILVEACKAAGIGSCAGVDLFEGAYDKLLKEKPHLSPQGLPGKPPFEGTFCYAEPEVRQYLLRIVAELAAYKPDRIFFCTKSSHVPNGAVMTGNKDSGFNPPAIRRYQELYGGAITPDQFDRKKLSAIHGDFLVSYLAAARQLLKKEGIEMVVGATVSGKLQVGGNLLLDYRQLIAAGATDAIAIGNSRGEYKVFNDEAGQQQFRDIAAACKAGNIRLYPYVIASGNYYSALANKYGYGALLNYLPKHMQYLQALGGDGVIIHDLDLIVFDPALRRQIWSAAGSRKPVGRIPEGLIPVPDITDTVGMPPFHKGEGTVTGNGSFEYSLAGTAKEQPAGWEKDTPEEGGVVAVYDWRVLHGSAYSGRNADGRSSVMLYLKERPAAASRATQLSGAWNAFIPLPDGLARGRKSVRIQVHGEDLSAIGAAGMRIGLLNRRGQLIREVDVPAPKEGNFPWQAIQAAVLLDKEVASLSVSLYLRASAGSAGWPTGRIWFDKFELIPLST